MAERSQRRVRRAGSYWRLLVHGIRGPEPGMSGAAHDVYSSPQDAKRHKALRDELGDYPTKDEETVTVLPGTEFDEFVAGHWCHIEQMDTGYWWMSVGGVTLHVRADRDGQPKQVMVHGPGDWDDPVKGCEYLLCWSADSRDPENDRVNGGDHG